MTHDRLDRHALGSRRISAHSSAAQVEDGRARLKETRLRRQAGAWQVLAALVAQPVVNVRFLQDHLGMGQVSARRALEQLTAAGVLTERTGQRRNCAWQHNGNVTVLDEYAAGLRRA